MAPSTQISSPLIAECPLNFECRLVRKVAAGKGAFYLAEVLETHVDEDALTGEKTIDILALDPLIFAPYGNYGNYHELGEKVGKGWDAGKALKK